MNLNLSNASACHGFGAAILLGVMSNYRCPSQDSRGRLVWVLEFFNLAFQFFYFLVLAMNPISKPQDAQWK